MEIIRANLDLPSHQAATLAMIDAYARDPMGDGAPLPADVRERLVPGLRTHPTTLVFLGFDAENPVGIAVCFLGFSTFAARALINIHDLAVRFEWRGQGVGRRLLEAVEAHARSIGCCKLTLEVQENNRRARSVYRAAGFGRASYVEDAGSVLCLSKSL